jgi:AraC family transcriptional regulator
MLDARLLLRIVHHLADRRSDPPALGELATAAGWSAYHLHRVFRAIAGETPKQYALRLQLEAAAAMLAATDLSAAEIGRRAGFDRPEVFTRAFRRTFGRPPAAWRDAVRPGPPPDPRQVGSVGPCVRLFHLPVFPSTPRPAMPDIALVRRDPQPVLLVRRRVPIDALQPTLAECLPAVFGHCVAHGIAMAGPPFTRYVEVGPGMLTVECGVPVVEPGAAGAGEIQGGELPGGDLAVAVHRGPYERLRETHGAIEQWIEASGLKAAGPAWETYLTDPAEHPDPADWRTEVCWPTATP